MGGRISVSILDEDERYIRRLGEYLKENRELPVVISLFADYERFLQFSEYGAIDVFIVDEFTYKKYISDSDFMEKMSVCLLVEEKDVESVNGLNVIYKYQKVENLIGDILKIVADEPVENAVDVTYESKNRYILSVYSPIGRCGKSKLCFELGTYLCKKGFKVLLLDLEEYSSYEKYTGNVSENNLSELMYYFLTNNARFSLRVDAALHTYRGLDCIVGVENPEDLGKVDFEKWMEFIRQIMLLKGYDFIILDISSMIHDYMKLLCESDYVIVPALEEEMSELKVGKFMAFVEASDYERILKKCKKIYTNRSIAECENLLEDIYDEMKRCWEG